MKRFAFGAAILVIGLGILFAGAHSVKAAEITVNYAPTQNQLSPQDAANLKQGLDILKKTLDLLGMKIAITPAPIPNASAINSSLDGLKLSLHQIDATLAALGKTGNDNVANKQNSLSPANQTVGQPQPENISNEKTANSEMAQVETSFDLKSLTWPAIAVLAVIVVVMLAIVLRRKMVKAKITNVKKNIQELKESSAPANSAQQNVGL